MRKYLTIISLAVVVTAGAQSTGSSNPRDEYEAFKRQARKEYTDFRDKANQEYADFMEKAWKEYTLDEPVPEPKMEEIGPVTFTTDTIQTAAAFYPDGHVKILPAPKPEVQPLPIAVIQETEWGNQGKLTFSYYGTPCTVRFDKAQIFDLPDLDPKTIADAWRVMAKPQYNNTIRDCLKLRKSMNLNDWAYLQMLQNLSEAALGKGNESRLLTSFLYTQSGYKTRIVKTAGTDPKIGLFYGTEYMVYNKPSLYSGGIFYYPLYDDITGSVSYVDYPFPKEQSVSLSMEREPQLAPRESQTRKFQSDRYPSMQAEIAVDENLITFFNDYPSWSKGDNFLTKWAFYAQTPMDPRVKRALYPQLMKFINPENTYESVNKLLLFCSTAFKYAYDDEVWGDDRAFFAEETLFYPYSDCEDRAIMFSHFVRDLLDLDVALVFYPGHLATAVAMGEDTMGDGINIDGVRYTICDPILTYGPGRSHPHVDKTKIQAIKLTKNEE